jgi:CRISPR system Cascade subunit CasE
MYLSRVEIETNNRQKIKDLSHLGAYHNWVEQSFPAEVANAQRNRHLWRIDILAGKAIFIGLKSRKTGS